MFDLFSDILAGLYALWPSYGAMIILLTLAVRIVFTPLTVRGTKSMLEMRKIQPELKKLQAKHKGDRAALNEEVQALYRTHKINPLGGCLPLLAQAPVFLVMYQVLRGLTRRISEVGKAFGYAGSYQCPQGPRAPECSELIERGYNTAIQDGSFSGRTFNPRYVDEGTQLSEALSSDTEMLWLGIDLSFSPSAALSESFVKALPYLVMVILVGVLGYYQQRQIAGRNPDVEVNPMQRTLMRVLPIFLPVISFSLPAGLIVYFITTSAIGVGQQAFITRRVYKPWNEAEEKRKELAESTDPEEEAEASGDQEKPKGLLEGLFGPKQEDQSIHGRRRPSSAPPPRPKAKPPSAKETSGSANRASANKASASKASASKALQQKAGSRSNNGSNGRNSRQTGVSKRVTPSKKQIEEANKNKRKRRR